MEFDLDIQEFDSIDGIENEEVKELDNIEENEETDEDSVKEIDSLDTDEEDPQESVGEEEEEHTEETPDSDEEGSSQLYSSIANALLEDGVFSSLSKEDLKDISDADDLKEAFQKQLQSQFDEQQKRILDALNYKVEPEKISTYEKTIQYLNSIDEDAIKSEENENLRKNLIYQSLINSGKSRERALKEVERSFKNGDDIEDALEAYQDNLDFYTESYEKEVQLAKEKTEKEEEKVKARAEAIKKAFDEKDFYEKIGISESVGKQAYIEATNARYRDSETGEMLTAIQKAQQEDEAGFLRGLGVAFTLTNGFKNFDKLFKGVANKQVKSKLEELEGKISQNSLGGIKYVGKNNKSKSTKINL